MSLFISGQAFPAQPAFVEEAENGILLGSLLSVVVACLILRFAPKTDDREIQARALVRDVAGDGDVKVP